MWCAGSLEGADGGQGEGHDRQAGPASAPHPGAHQGATPLLLHLGRPSLWPGKASAPVTPTLPFQCPFTHAVLHNLCPRPYQLPRSLLNTMSLFLSNLSVEHWLLALGQRVEFPHSCAGNILQYLGNRGCIIPTACDIPGACLCAVSPATELYDVQLLHCGQICPGCHPVLQTH